MTAPVRIQLSRKKGWRMPPNTVKVVNALRKQPHVRFDWTPQKLRDVARWANHRAWRYARRFEDYQRSARTGRNEQLTGGLFA